MKGIRLSPDVDYLAMEDEEGPIGILIMHSTGEIVTIDGGEWISKAGQFNMLEKVPKKLWGAINKMTRKKK